MRRIYLQKIKQTNEMTRNAHVEYDDSKVRSNATNVNCFRLIRHLCTRSSLSFTANRLRISDGERIKDLALQVSRDIWK
jgi:hypothetical protein